VASLAEYLIKPEYLFRPSQVLRRLARTVRPSGADRVVLMPWGLPLRIHGNDDIGRALWTTGVYDLAVSEALWRLLDPGETAVDAGANIGYMTSLLAVRAGPGGAVRAFEPHPGVFSDLAANRGLWNTTALAAIELREVGLSDCAREARLVEGPDFEANRGTARVAEGTAGLAVRLTTLDQEFAPAERIGLLKVDVEGHEAAVLAGAERMLAARAIRDIVYEEHAPGAGPATALLRSRGYHVFGIVKGLLGPALGAPERGGTSWTPPSCLGTAEPERARARFAPRGWECLVGR
jgi:FkbM family methyltransferase